MQKHVDPTILAHLEWIGFVRPTGLVVSAPALVRNGAILPRNDVEGQRLLTSCVVEQGGASVAPDFCQFAATMLGWSFSPKGYAGLDIAPIPPELQVTLPEYGETLEPDLAVRELTPAPNAAPWQLLVKLLPTGQGFDQVVKGHGSLEASAHGRMERLLRQSGVSAGLLFNGHALRLISAPRGESSGWVDFRIADMLLTAGRPILSAMRLLLSEQRLLALPRGERLAALLEESRKYQNEVSERLAEQVLHALYALLRGFQAANDDTNGKLLHAPLRDEPDTVYRGLLTVILRLVFLLYAEERDMLPKDDVWQQGYSLAGLYERLREDAALYPDTMQQRYGAWAQLLVLFRMIFDGAPELGLPRRHGVLFDPDRFPFLEGRAGDARQIHERITPPRVPDGTVYQALEKLLLLDGERISYRALDVEQIGSVYETMMGFRLEAAKGRSLAIRPAKKHGAPTTVSLDALLETSPAQRAKWLQEQTERTIPASVSKGLPAAKSIPELHAALRAVVDTAATPDIVPPGAMVLQPSAERRRSGSHYTPRALTEPIVRTTLEPVLARLRGASGLPPRPEQILDLKICDPAMGSGAFLVEACRQLGDALVEAWGVHGGKPPLPPDEDEVIFARRLVAQRCLYGVDKNPTAVDLAKVSLWLVTLAKEHALTFVDHALRHGDSLVGLSYEQIRRFHWQGDAPVFQYGYETKRVSEQVDAAAELRAQIRHAGDNVSDSTLQDLWHDAQAALLRVNLYGDLVARAFFEGANPKQREAKRKEYAAAMLDGSATQHFKELKELREADPPLAPFHWEIEFPEVFQQKNSGFDAIVGNPPFLGGSKISTAFGMTYFQWLIDTYPPCGHLCDLVAYFFRRSFNLLRLDGSFGLIATNTIAQGDTREGGLTTITQNDGCIYSATRRYRWPGQAAVMVSVVHVLRGKSSEKAKLDGVEVQRISSYLFPGDIDSSPSRLASSPFFSLGSKIYGQGFLFADEDPECTPIIQRQEILKSHPELKDRVPPYIGGEEINTHPRHQPHRYVIYLSDVSEESQLSKWPELRRIVEAKVKPERLKLGDNPNNIPLKRRWWAYQAHRPELYEAIKPLNRVLVNSQVSSNFAFTFLSTGMVYAHTVNVFPFETFTAFCTLQSRPHEFWARFLGSSMKDDLRYTASDCFETFPFPKGWETHSGLEVAGKAYYEYRAALMVRNDEGLTKTYNRFHNPYEHDPEIVELRELHAAMDRAVLDAYGWNDIPTDCEFLLDYEIDEEEWGTKKKPYRYRWPDEVRDEVLARLLELNAERARQEQLMGQGKTKGGGKRRKAQLGMQDMFEG